MHWLDITLLIILGAGAALGAWSGLLWQIARIVTFIVAIYCCIFFHEPVAQFLSEQIDGTSDTGVGMKLLAYVVTFVGIFVVFYTTTWLIELGIKAAQLKMYDRLLGAAAGALKMSLVSGAILMGLAMYASDTVEDTFRESFMARGLLTGMSWVVAVVPEEYSKECQDRLTQFSEKMAKEGIDKAKEKTLEGAKGK